jgi:Flp pilus assembly protein TadG
LRRLRVLSRQDRGQALLEFALILPLLLLLVLGIIEFGRAWNLAQLMSDVAREGARRAVVADPTVTETQVHDFMDQKLATAGVPIGAATITFSKTGANPTTGWHSAGQQTVTVVIPYSFMFFGDVFGTIPLTSSFTMRME